MSTSLLRSVDSLRLAGLRPRESILPNSNPAKTADGSRMLIGNADCRQSVGKRVRIELRIGSRPRNRSDIRDKINMGSTHQLSELLGASVGMADHEKSFTRRPDERP